MTRSARPHRATADDGFTIVEVIAAMAVFLIVSTAAVAILVNGLQAIRENADRVNAAGLARSHLEDLRSRGAETLTAGRTTSTVTQGAVTYTVTTDATWVTIDQTVDSCQVTIDPDDLSFMRVHVEVMGGSLSAPQGIDGLVPRLADVRDPTRGSISVRVVDDQGVGVPGVVVTLTNSAAAGQPAIYETDVDGCLLVDGAEVSDLWQVSIARDGFVAPTLAGTTGAGSVLAGLNTPFSFSFAPAASLRLVTPDDTYVLPRTIPITLAPDDRFRTPLPPLDYPLTVTELFPGAYEVWPGTCSDAGLAPTPVTAVAGEEARAELTGVPIDIVAAPGTRVRLEHRPFASPAAGSCPDDVLPDYLIGTVDDSWSLRALLPTGDWRFTATTSDDTALDPIALYLDDTLPAPCSVVWDTGLESRAEALAAITADAANAVADEPDNEGIVTRAILRGEAERTIADAPASYNATWQVGPDPDEVTVSSRLGSVTASVLIRITAAQRAEIRGETSLTIGDPPAPFTTSTPCIAATP